MKPKTSTVNLNAKMAAELDALVEKHHPFVSRHAIHVAALQLGLELLTQDTSRLVAILSQRAA